MMKIARLRGIGDKIGRVGMSKLVLDAIEQFDGTSKGAMSLCGELELIAKMATCDEYWSGKVALGRQKMTGKLGNVEESMAQLSDINKRLEKLKTE